MGMTQREKMSLLENMLDQLSVAVTFADPEGEVRYLNRASRNRSSPVPREVGLNIFDCHSRESIPKIKRIFREFQQGRRQPHQYVTQSTGRRELVTLIPVFEQDAFRGCLSQISPLETEGPWRTFE
jgi:DUF438 domain-containing protein